MPVTEGTSFVGRERDLGRLRALVAAGERIVTVVGQPGIGKTRLVQEAVRAEPDGASFCSLAQALDVEGITRGVAAGIGVSLPAMGSPVAQLGRIFVDRRIVLLVLDNVEQAIAPTREVLTMWRDFAPVVVVAAHARRAASAGPRFGVRLRFHRAGSRSRPRRRLARPAPGAPAEVPPRRVGRALRLRVQRPRPRRSQARGDGPARTSGERSRAVVRRVGLRERGASRRAGDAPRPRARAREPARRVRAFARHRDRGRDRARASPRVGAPHARLDARPRAPPRTRLHRRGRTREHRRRQPHLPLARHLGACGPALIEAVAKGEGFGEALDACGAPVDVRFGRATP